jgi:hypothetical protein
MTGTTPVPASVNVLTGNGALVVNVKLAVLVVAATGVKVMRRLQEVFGATAAAHSVLSMANKGSLETAELSDNGAVPQFVTAITTVFDCPTRVRGKVRTPKLLGRQTAGASAVGLIFAANP